MDNNKLSTIGATLVLISEKVRFWSDETQGVDGSKLSPRCMDVNRMEELRRCLLIIDEHCKNVIKLIK